MRETVPVLRYLGSFDFWENMVKVDSPALKAINPTTVAIPNTNNILGCIRHILKAARSLT